MRKQPQYKFEEIDSSTTPYRYVLFLPTNLICQYVLCFRATVIINGLEYPHGFGTSKKLAKNDAARKALQILIPELKDEANEEENHKEEDFFEHHAVRDQRHFQSSTGLNISMFFSSLTVLE